MVLCSGWGRGPGEHSRRPGWRSSTPLLAEQPLHVPGLPVSDCIEGGKLSGFFSSYELRLSVLKIFLHSLDFQSALSRSNTTNDISLGQDVLKLQTRINIIRDYI